MGEVQALALKAARGAGYPWAMAEDAGRAVRWLCEGGADGCGALVSVLEQGFAGALPQHSPRIEAEGWQGTGALCPLITGAAVSDFARIWDSRGLELTGVAAPILIVPFAAQVVRNQDRFVEVRCGPARAVSDGVAVAWTGTFGPMGDVAVALCDEVPDGARALTRAEPDPDDWAVLLTFADKTYAPATEASRRLGAGGETPDTD